MKHTIRSIILVLLFCLPATPVRAEDAGLFVTITSYTGESIAVKDGEVIYSSLPVTFTPTSDSGDNYYCISTDDGETFGGYAKADGPVTLYPDDETAPFGRWQIRFRNVTDEKETLSSLYKLSFDVTAPSVEPEDPDTLTKWFADDTTINFVVSDDQSGIARIVAKNSDKVIAQTRIAEGEAKVEHTFPVEINDSIKVSCGIDIECFDLAGNMGCLSIPVKLDQSIPEVAVSGVSNGSCLSSDCALVISATDRDSDVTIDYEITRIEGSMMYSTKVSSAPPDTTLGFSEDGHYSVDIYATDSAGNRSRKVSRDFTVDTSAPQINIGGITKGVDIRSAASVSVDVAEKMPEGSKVNISLLRKSPAGSQIIPLDSYSLQANRDIRMVNINDDGEYELTVSAEDAAGNRSTSSESFRVDATAPSISLSGLNEGETLSEIPVLKFCAGELFYDSTVMTAILEKKERSGYQVVETKNLVMRSPTDNMDVAVPGEGMYRLTCRAADRSGNTAEKTTAFSVDATPPVITGLDAIGGKYYKSFSIPSALSSFVRDATSTVLGAYINDEKAQPGQEVIKEGKYTLTLYAEDEAHNWSEDTAEFIVDHTAPQIVLSGFDRDGNIRKGSMVTVSLSQSADMLKSVLFNGSGVSVSPDNRACFEVNDYGDYTIDVVAEDPAGNVTDTSIHTSCYMYPAPVARFIGKQEELVSDIASTAQEADKKGVIFGLISTLSGAAGIVYKVKSRG